MKKFLEGKIKLRIFRSLKKIGVCLLVFSFLSALWIVPGTNAGFSDEEKSAGNFFQASALDFSLKSNADFLPMVTPSQSAGNTIDLENEGLMDFTYGVKIQNASGALCAFLEVKDDSNSYQPLISFQTTAAMTFSTMASMVFEARLTSASKALQNQKCEFKFIFDGEQIDGAGFSDTEEIVQTITAGAWPSVVINKVYYDVDGKHGNEDENEWIELYNPTDSPIDMAGWKIIDNTGQDTLPSSSPIIIPSLGYAVITNKNATWNYWQIPADVIKIELNSKIGSGLANDNDMLVLLNLDNAVVDQMNWGTPSHTWANYSAYSTGIWEPGVANADEGHMLARVPSGLDTDAVSDWQDLEAPEVKLLYPIGGEKWYVGQTYNLLWTAHNTNAVDSDKDLKIDLYYSNDSGQSWAPIVMDTYNDGSFEWKVSLFLDNGHYYVPSPTAQIKVVATGPENFMVQAQDESEDFCPPIDYDALSPEEQELVDQLVAEGLIDESEVIRGGVSVEDILDGMESAPELEIGSEDILSGEEISLEVLEIKAEAEEQKLAELQAELQSMETGDILSPAETTLEPEEEVESVNSAEADIPASNNPPAETPEITEPPTVEAEYNNSTDMDNEQ